VVFKGYNFVFANKVFLTFKPLGEKGKITAHGSRI
jgi:hypothetical protein